MENQYKLIENEFKHGRRSSFNVYRALVEFIVAGLIIVGIYTVFTNKTLISSFFPEQKKSYSVTYEEVLEVVKKKDKAALKEITQKDIEFSGRFLKRRGSYIYVGPVGGSATKTPVKCFVGDADSKLNKESQKYSLGAKVDMKGTFKSLKSTEMTFSVSSF